MKVCNDTTIYEEPKCALLPAHWGIGADRHSTCCILDTDTGVSLTQAPRLIDSFPAPTLSLLKGKLKMFLSGALVSDFYPRLFMFHPLLR